MDTGVAITAVATSVPATIAAIAALRSAKNVRFVKDQTTPSNGVTVAAMVEELSGDIRAVKQDLHYHVAVQHGGSYGDYRANGDAEARWEAQQKEKES